VRRLLSVLAAAALLASPVLAQQAPKPSPAKSAEWKPETFELANGMKAVVLPDHRAPVVTHMLWFRVGAADEVKGKSGLAHFLEHLMFKATDKIPAGEYSKIIARNGGQDNAGTSSDFTNYHFRVAKDRLPLMMEMEADRMTGLKLEENEVLPERAVVQEERRMRVDSEPGSLLNEKVMAAMYAGHPYAVPVIGYMSEVEKLTQVDAQEWYRRWYGPENAILVVAGDITAAELKPMAEKIYGVIPKRGDLQVRAWPQVKSIPKSVELSHSDSKVRQPDWTRNWLGVAIGDPDSEALQVGTQILGGGRTSRLYRELVEPGTAVSAYAYSMESEARGMIGVSASPGSGVTVAQIEKAALAVTDKFLKEGPTAEEMTRAKKMIAAEEIFARDNQAGMANWYGALLTAGQTVEWIGQSEERINAVTAEQVSAAMKKYMTGANHVDAVLLPEGR
jgi:zinc protease